MCEQSELTGLVESKSIKRLFIHYVHYSRK